MMCRVALNLVILFNVRLQTKFEVECYWYLSELKNETTFVHELTENVKNVM